MFEVSVQSEFCAAHAIIMQGARETVHGHNWQVTAAIQGPALDHDGLLCDFHALETALSQVIAPFHNADLNHTPPFTDLNPSAENIARHIAHTLQTRLKPSLPPGANIAWVKVTEAPRCATTYWPTPL